MLGIDRIILDIDIHFLIVGTVFLVFAVSIRIWIRHHRRQSVKVLVEILENRESKDSDGRTFYYPVFRIVSGPYESVKWSSRVGDIPALHKTGERVPGLYNPHTGVIRSDKMNILAACSSEVFFVFGAGGALIGLYPSRITILFFVVFAGFGAMIRLFFRVWWAS